MAIEPGQTLSHYRLLDKVGEGGMGVVYRARDEHLRRDVAVKLLAPGSLGDERARQRFRTEARALSRLNHPNIETAHDFDSAGGRDFLVMEFVPGTTLSERLAGGPLPEPEILRLGRQLMDGLAAAHEQGILHRDLKPNNLRVTSDGRLKVLDFGLAKLLRPVPAASAAETELLLGGLAGTLPYMAPEQLRGEEEDVRADLYAAGVVLYEMATGQPPHRARVATALADAILHEPPPPPRSRNPGISAGLEQIILRCLEKAPGRRYASARELGDELRRLAESRRPRAARARPIGRRGWRAAAAVLAVLALALALWAPRLADLRGWLFGAGPEDPIRSLAVLPLDNLSRDPDQLYFVDGMHEALIASLAKIGALRVISRTSAMRYRGSAKPLPQIGRELGVDAIVEGSVLRAGDRVRISAQLVHAGSDTHMWTESYEGDLSDVLRLQSETARAIAREIRIVVTAEDEARLEDGRPVDRAAYEEFLKGRHYLNQRTRNEIFLSLDYFQRSLEIDPSFALAHVAWAEASILTGWYSWVAPGDAFPPAQAAAERALALEPASAEAHTMAAAVKMLWEWDYLTAETEFRRAIELNPGYPRAHHWYALFLTYMTRYDEAVAEIRRARQLDPLSTIIRAIEGMCYCHAGRYEEAVRAARQALEISPDFPFALGIVTCGNLGLGRYEEAIADARRALEVSGGAIELADLIEVYQLAGRRQEALELLVGLEARAEREHVAATTMAATYLIVGRHEQALEWLERAYEEHSWSLIFLRRRLYDPLRSDPRFQDLYQRVGLASAMLPPRGGPSLEPVTTTESAGTGSS